MERLEPHAEVGDAVQPSGSSGKDPASRRALIAVRARKNPKEKFNNLLHHLTYKQVEECLGKTPTTSAVGVDGMTVRQARENLSWLLPPLLKQIHEGRYEPPPVRRVYLPKPDGRQRPIGVPAVVDRAIQAGAAAILNEIYEQDFLSCSFGFRPKLGCHHALATVNELLYRRKLNYALEVDIRDFFGSLGHEWLRKFLEHRISDRRMLKLVDAWLSAGVMEQGRWKDAESGTPQGGSISPLLANVYLHYVVDLWFERRIKKQLRGRAQLVRYADDFVILCENPEDIDTVHILLRARLAQFGLSIAEEKTHVTDLRPRERGNISDRRRMTFLGFEIFQTRKRQGTGSKVVFQTEGKCFSRAKATLKQLLHRRMHQPVEKQADALNAFLTGHYNYYGLAGNTRRLAQLGWYALRYWRLFLGRRSQRGRISWEAMERLLQLYPLISPRVHLGYAQLGSLVRL